MFNISRTYKKYKTRKQFKSWRIGDYILLSDLSQDIMLSCCEAHPARQPVAILLGWSKEEVLVSFYNKQRWYVNLTNIKNLSLELREKEQRVNDYMTALFDKEAQDIQNQTLEQESVPNQSNIFCKVDLNQLPSQELETLLDEASSREDYEVAAKIRDILTKRQ